MTPAEKKVVDAAIAFINEPEMQEHLKELEGTNSASAPAEFMLLGEAVENLEKERAEAVEFAKMCMKVVDEKPPSHDQKREAAISFAFGNATLHNPNITREMVEKAYDELKAAGELKNC